VTESSGAWLTREVLMLIGLVGALFSAALYVFGLVLTSIDGVAWLTGHRLPTLLKSVGGWALATFMAGEGALAISHWLLRLGTHPDEKPAEGPDGK
jgi:hypothetical protein